MLVKLPSVTVKKGIIRIGGKRLSLRAVAKKYRCSRVVLARLLEGKPNYEQVEIIKDKIWAASEDLKPKSRVYRRGDCRCAALVVVDLIGCTTATANNRLRAWEAGKADTDDLLRPLRLESFTRNGQVITANDLLFTGYSRSVILKKLHAWQEDGDCDELLRPPKKLPGQWGGLSSKSRDYNLAKIKIGTWEAENVC